MDKNYKELEDVIPASCNYDYVENFVITKNFLTPAECRKLVRDCKKHGLMNAEVSIKNESKTDENIRDSKLFFIEYDTAEFDWFFEKMLQTLVNVNQESFNFDVVGFSEPMQFTQYDAPAGHYDDHIDKLLQGKVRKLTMVIQLTDPSKYEGGELEVCLGGKPFEVPKEQGTLITFPSYVLHRVRPTTEGTRHSMVAWATGRPFR
jgi:PKHD-type hydroxylase